MNNSSSHNVSLNDKIYSQLECHLHNKRQLYHSIVRIFLYIILPLSVYDNQRLTAMFIKI